MLELLVQTATGTSNLASTPVTFGSNTVGGNSIIVACGNTSGTASDVSGVTDTQGNVYTKILATANVLLGEVELWYTSGIIGGANTITVAYTTGVACAVIAREYYGLLYANTIDKSASNTGNSNSLSSSATTAITQTNELVVGAGVIPLANTFTVGAGYVNLTTLAAPLTITMAMEDLFTATGGAQTATFGSNASIQWVCAIATFYLLPTGTTTSTSSTSASTFSTSSTSSSISSTSSSISSTSTSTSFSSTSSSVSSTSSSVSSTSSSVSSTSLSSTSSSTSFSSTSTSISSTSTSSTSMSSTSSSTSVSSTSTSFSSTSSSVSSTSSSVSSTSFSSTSSSSSTSTTTLPPPYLTYSYQDIVEQYATPTLLQTKTGSMTGTVASTNVSLNTTANASLVVVTMNTDSTASGTVTSVACSGMSFIKLDERVGGSNTASMWYAFNITSQTTPTLTVNWNVVANGGIIVREYSGISTTSPLDVHATFSSGVGTSSTPACGVGYLTAYNDLIIGYCGTLDGTNTYTAGKGYGNITSLVWGATTGDMGMEDRVLGRTQGLQTANISISNLSTFTSGIAAFKAAVLPLPSTGTSLTNAFTVPQYSNASGDDGDYFIEKGSRYLIQEYKNLHNNNTDAVTFTWKGRTTVSTITNPLLIQIYNVSTATWETLANLTLLPADTDTQTTVTKSTNVANYYDTRNIVTFRSYQQVN